MPAQDDDSDTGWGDDLQVRRNPFALRPIDIDHLIRVYRIHHTRETEHIEKVGRYELAAGNEGKYFFLTEEQAHRLGGFYSIGGIGVLPYSVSTGLAPRSVLEGAEDVDAISEGPGVFVRGAADLARIIRVRVLGRARW